jgi:cytochrome c oxidase subunit 3
MVVNAVSIAQPEAAAAERPPAALPCGVLGMLIFLGTEAMFFAGLISAFLVLRAGAGAWPPADQPRLPIVVTSLNTLVLLASAHTLYRGLRAVRDDRPGLVQWLAATAALGVVFLLVQGAEWLRLLGYGLRISSGTYGATFYALIGCHALHVLGGVMTLLWVLRQAARRRYSAREHVAVEVGLLYWFFVVGVWPVLYVLVYLG